MAARTPILAIALSILALGAVPTDGLASGTAQVNCLSSAGYDHYVVRPSDCAFNPAGQAPSGAGTVFFSGLEWHRWGRKRATATGIGAFHGEFPRERLILSRLVRCGGHRRYALLRYGAAGGGSLSAIHLNTCGTD